MNILLTTEAGTLSATLSDSPASRDLLAQLPLTLKLEDFAATEKIAYLPRELSIGKAPAGYQPSAGDLTYYAPWGNLAIFYKAFGYAQGLVYLGSIGGDLLALQEPLAKTLTITAGE